jgi:hypothetical protein
MGMNKTKPHHTGVAVLGAKNLWQTIISVLPEILSVFLLLGQDATGRIVPDVETPE